MLQNANGDQQYDTYAKAFLGRKDIIAWILVNVVGEFKGMDPAKVKELIVGEPLISKVFVDPGLTNVTRTENGNRVTEFNTESSAANEGLVRFDIIFMVQRVSGLSKFIINLEPQKNKPKGYKLMNRAVYYVCRLISSQKDRDFTGEHYDDIKSVYSIWICMNHAQNSLVTVKLESRELLGRYKWEGGMDLINIVMVGLSNTIPPKEHKEYELHRLLGALFAMEAKMNERISILDEEFKLELNGNGREELEKMGSWSEAFYNSGYSKGETIGETIGETKGIAKGIKALIRTCRRHNVSKDDAVDDLMQSYDLQSDEARRQVELYWQS